MYHVNPETGKFDICYAKSPESCPFGCENHSENYEEIQIKADKINKFLNEYNIISKKLSDYDIEISEDEYKKYHKDYRNFKNMEKSAIKELKKLKNGKSYCEYYCKYCNSLSEDDFIYYAIDFENFKDSDNSHELYKFFGFSEDDEFNRCKYIIMEVNDGIKWNKQNNRK